MAEHSDPVESAERDRRSRRASALRQLVSELRGERDRRIAELADRAELEHESAQDVSEPRDPADFGTVQNDVDRQEALVVRSARRLDAIQDAIARAAQGRFGTCDACGGAIALDRLRALPAATLCGECAEEAERIARRS